MDELVSIIMPSYNTEKFVDKTIKSVLSQTYENWELLIVDDCSTDNSIQVIKSFNDSRIKIFINDKNSGAALSRNKALKEAKGKWIAFLDSDDIWDKNKLRKQIDFMLSNKYNFSYTKYIEIDENDNELGIVVTGPRKITKHKMFNYCWLGCLSVMYNAEAVGLIQIDDLKKNNDYAMWLKVIKQTNCYFLNEMLAKYRIRKGSISNHSKLKLIKHHYYLFRKSEKKCPLVAFFYTTKNLFWGVWKKVRYVKKYKVGD